MHYTKFCEFSITFKRKECKLKMNFDIEKKFVKDFIKKEYAERLNYELMKKREKGLSRFSHNVIEIINEKIYLAY